MTLKNVIPQTFRGGACWPRLETLGQSEICSSFPLPWRTCGGEGRVLNVDA